VEIKLFTTIIGTLLKAELKLIASELWGNT
jgi:hypothetical protein